MAGGQGGRGLALALERLLAFIGLGSNSTSHQEKWVSVAGGLCGILGILILSEHYLGLAASAGIVASMGASAVLLFAVPHGPLSQPWPLVGGHLVSALVGVTCAQWIPVPIVAAAVAVGLAIGVMHYCRCIHPPGGATALVAVIGGEQVHSLGYQFVLTPVMLNAISILLLAVLFNYAFPWRRYPAALSSAREAYAREPDSSRLDQLISHEDLESALQTIGTTLDVSEKDLQTIVNLANQHAQQKRIQPREIILGRYYSNGEYGANWQVRRVVDMAHPARGDDDLVIYRVVAGQNRRSSGTESIADFARWAKYEVELNENSWQRK